jgi:hypothetical protein
MRLTGPQVGRVRNLGMVRTLKVSHVMDMMTYLDVRDVHFAGRHRPSNFPFKSRHLTVERAEYQLHDFQDAGTSIEEDRLGVCENVREHAEENVRKRAKTCEKSGMSNPVGRAKLKNIQLSTWTSPKCRSHSLP